MARNCKIVCKHRFQNGQAPDLRQLAQKLCAVQKEVSLHD